MAFDRRRGVCKKGSRSFFRRKLRRGSRRTMLGCLKACPEIPGSRNHQPISLEKFRTKLAKKPPTLRTNRRQAKKALREMTMLTRRHILASAVAAPAILRFG